MRIQLFSFLLLLIPLFQILHVARVSGQCLDDQRSLLLQLKNSLKYNSSSSKKLVNWNQTTIDCCNWDGIACDNSGHVISLNLENEFISNGIENSTSLFALRYLQKLNLALNTFSNSIQIPKGLQNLTNLAYLNLSNAGFGGQIPIELSFLRNLVVLDLSNLFPGIEPLKLENPNLKTLVQNLTGLKELYLDAVDISAQNSDWTRALSSSLPNLTNLSLRGCSLPGPLDPSLLQLRSLSVLHLDQNDLSTTKPDFFANFSSLTILTLGSCSLTGTFPESIFQVPSLQTLDLSYNNLLKGTIQQFPRNSSFQTIVLRNTNFSGSIPDSIVNLRMLSKIDLFSCNFTGPIPSTMANLTELVYLDFSVNNFTGSIPLFRMSKKLNYIDLSRNSLTGILSNTHFEGLNSLVYINLGYNSLTGSIPSSLFGLPLLQRLQLSNNEFRGQVNEFSTSNYPNLDTLDLSNNNLVGPIPESFFGLEQLSVLSLSSNFFNGTTKLEKIQRLSNLTRLDLGHNNLTVDVSSGNILSLPQLLRLNLASCKLSNFPDLRNQSKISFLDLSSNRISGEIPIWIWNIGNNALNHLNLSYNLLVGFQRPINMPDLLNVLDLHSNRLQGELPLPPNSVVYIDYSSNHFQNTIPIDIGNSTLFTNFLSLANNNLTGKIPESLCNPTYLQVLDLSGNNLNGSIPSCLTNTLGVLNLGRNQISGIIPDNFSVSCSLKTLDLSNNNLGGHMPFSLANCKSLEVMNVGNNKIKDTFPCMLKNLSALRVLVLRRNKFHGELRCPMTKNGSWPDLQIIDIAFNNFTGKLSPECIANWRGMTVDKNGDQPRQNKHIQFDFLSLNNFYYQDMVMVTIKGLEMELIKILKVFTVIDFSCNNFSGPIPDTIGNLTSLYILNLSHNALDGNIPSTVGNLKQLGSLDLSSNGLTGEIPREIAGLNFLSFLNLSYNKLVGMIPTGSQFQTFSKESYVGNPELCGFPLNKSCNFDGERENLGPGLSGTGFDWRFILTGLGFGFGASLVVAPLALCERWRGKCDGGLDQLLKMVFPGYGSSHIRYDNKVEAVEDIEDDEDEEESGDKLSIGRYCVFCTKLDIQIKRAVHNQQCTCYNSPPMLSTPTTTSSSSSSLLVVCRESN
ncbi:receptor-like protein 12 [Phtheirospermum japonicum]|uniref:Receptor-like protein 12 n=1 Tax=Phtheirospermum japonicum TaxID=374723 RepID=A0A830CMF4_9LAMI|nr:receptor-like protein 12 [Phtheirospermum japonicum]